MNIANMKRFAKRRGIKNPMALSTSVLIEMYKLEKERTRRILADSAWMRTEYLNAKQKDAVIADAAIQSIYGTNLSRIIPPAARQLNSKVDRIRIPYNEKLESLFREHNIYDRLQSLAKTAAHPSSANARHALEVLDNQIEQFILSSESKCRKIRVGHYEFSLAVKSYLDRCHSLKWLLRYR